MDPTHTHPDAELAERLLDTIPAVMKLLHREMRGSSGTESGPGFSLPQLRLMAHVKRGAATATELADLQGVSLAAISKLIETMVKKGLLRREYRDGNRKQIFLKLTDRGLAALAEIRSAARTGLLRHVERLPGMSKNALASGLGALSDLVAVSKT